MSAIDTCSLCPRLCRTACPVATGAAREAAVPAQIASAVLAWRQGRLPEEVVRRAVTSCVDCGACQDLCHLHMPLPEALSALRRELRTAPAPPKLTVPGAGDVLLVVTPREEALGDGYRAAVQEAAGQPVGIWRAPLRLGEGSLEHRNGELHLDAVRAAVAGRRVVTAHRGVEAVLRAADVGVVPLWELVGRPAPCGCGTPDGPLSCCGGRAPFAVQHEGDARRMGAYWALRDGPRTGLDSRCASHLRASGVDGVGSFAEEWLLEVTGGA